VDSAILEGTTRGSVDSGKKEESSVSKMDEQVLVFPYCAKRELKGAFPGMVLHDDQPGNLGVFTLKVLLRSYFMRRGDIEDDPATQQIIPYVVVQDVNGDILVYNRGSSGGEERLARKWSIGVGGHVNMGDALPFSEFPTSSQRWTIIHKAIKRELLEELEGLGDIRTPSFFGFLDVDTTPVDEVHFGIVFKLICTDSSKVKPSSEIEEIRWVTLEELKSYELENWSELVRDALGR
jgi:predicted NUDIX family phosphoesterase